MKRCATQIEQTCKKLETALFTTAIEADILEINETDVLPNPSGNCPLKIYVASRGDINQMTQSNWSPPLLLGHKQQEIHTLSGTVLLLGRSGTGKTVCLCDRMTRDRVAAQLSGLTNFSQLFVSRSKRLCEFVKHYQTSELSSTAANTNFMTLDSFVSH